MLANDVPFRAFDGFPMYVVTALPFASAPSISGSDKFVDGEKLELRGTIYMSTTNGLAQADVEKFNHSP